MFTTIRPATNLDMARIQRIGGQIRQLETEMKAIFPSRDSLITQAVYSLLTREHVMIFGPHGTGKSDLINTLFGVFTDADLFSISLNKFMTESSVIGLPNPKEMRETGRILYPLEGILTADFVELDEFLDANPALLRVLLGVLNERIFKRGRQIERVRLRTAVASTNRDPEQEVKNNKELAAVVDRFLFHCDVGYLGSSEDRRRMYQKYLQGEKPTVSLPLDDLDYISGIVVSANQITDPYFCEVYDRIIEGYVTQTGDVISDRRKCKLLQLIEAHALLFGRYEVVPEDIQAIRWGLCLGTDTAKHDVLRNVAEPVIAEANERLRQNIDEVQLRLLGEYEGKFARLLEEYQQRVARQQCDPGYLAQFRRDLLNFRKEVTDVKPELESTEDRQNALLGKVDTSAQEVLDRIDNG